MAQRIAILVMLACSSCAQQNDKVSMLLQRLETSSDEAERALIVGTELWKESDPRIEKAYVRRLSRGTTAEDLYVAWYLAKRGNRDALRILNDNYFEYPTSSWEWSYVVRVFGRYKYAPAIPNLIGSLRAACLNLGGAAYATLCEFYPDAPTNLPGPESAYQYFKKRLAAEQGPLGEGQFAVGNEAAVGAPDLTTDDKDLPPPARCGKWVVRADRPEKGVVQLVLSESSDGAGKEIFTNGRSVTYFWITSADRPLLAINDHSVSNDGHALIYDPQTGRTLELGQLVWKQLGNDWTEKLHHIYSDTVAFSPDGKRLILHMFGHGDNGYEDDEYVVADAATGEVIRHILDPDLIGSKWWE